MIDILEMVMKILLLFIIFSSCLFISASFNPIYSQEQNTQKIEDTSDVVAEKQETNAKASVDFLQQDPNMDVKYQKGPWLVYDCLDNHWVCTRELEYRQCQSHRKKAILDNEKELPCAYFNKFKSQESCWIEQTKLTNRAEPYLFCLHPEEQKKEI